eukprot:TRINITY_DN81347_c0_g1_i1.p1 TRINITY_DN81347_c0_g1~~TRINITY_DN81347_c0_g1_i1.p1  ORF type:complete len:1071 (-),score=125.86 TRINITY_DN81347_c0_g1_i1:487-3699(-)
MFVLDAFQRSFLFLSILSTVAVTVPVSLSDSPLEKGLPLSKWLKETPLSAANVSLALPVLKIPLVGEVELLIHIVKVTCLGIEVGNVTVPSSYTMRRSFGFEIDVRDASLQSCSAQAYVQPQPALLPSEYVDISLALTLSSAMLQAKMTFKGDSPPLPVAVHLLPGSEGCSLTARFDKLQFEGTGVLPAVLNAIVVPFLKSSLGEDLIEQSFCDGLEFLLRDTVTADLERLWNANTTKPAVSRDLPSYDEDVVDLQGVLSSNTVVGAARAFASDVLYNGSAVHLNRNLKTIFDSVDFPWPPRFDGPFNRTLHVEGSDLKVLLHGSALDCAALDVLEVRGGASNASLSLEPLLAVDCSVELAALIELPSSPSLFLGPQRLRVAVDEAGLGAQLSVGLRSEVFSMLYLDQLQSPSCILSFLGKPSDANRTGLELRSYMLDAQGLKVLPVGVDATADPLFAATVRAALSVFEVFFDTAGAGFLALLAGQGATDSVTSLVNKAIRLKLDEHLQCPESLYDPGDVPALVEWSRYAFFTFGAVMLAATVVACVLTKEKAGAPAPQEEDMQDGNQNGDTESQTSTDTDVHTMPLCKSTCIGRVPKVIIPMLLGANLALFLMANGAVISHIKVAAWSSEDTQALPPLFSFGLWNTAGDFLNAKCWPLAFFAIAWTILWPFGKLFMMLACWMTPPRWLSVPRRGAVLTFLDQVGKLSLFDSFLMTILIVGFEFRWVGAGEDGGKALIMQATAESGYFFLVAGTVFSLVLGEVLIYFHRVADDQALAYNKVVKDLSDSISRSFRTTSRRPSLGAAAGLCTISENQPMSRPLTRENEERRSNWSILSPSLSDGRVPVCQVVGAGWGMQVVLVMAIAVAFLTFGIGCLLVSFNFDISGLVGGVYTVMGTPTHSRFTIHKWITSMPPSTPTIFTPPDSVCMWLVCVGAWIFVLVTPMAYLLCLACLWFLSIPSKRQFQLFALCQILGAWSMLDIAVAAVIASVLGGASFGVEHLIHNMLHHGLLHPLCDLLQRTLGAEVVVFQPALETGMWYMVVAALCIHAVSMVMFKSIKGVIEDKRHPES